MATCVGRGHRGSGTTLTGSRSVGKVGLLEAVLLDRLFVGDQLVVFVKHNVAVPGVVAIPI